MAERNPLHEQSALSKPLAWITAQTLRAPGAVIVGALLLALLSVFVTLNGLNFKTSRLDLLNPRSQYNQRWLAYLAEFGERDDAVIVVRGDDPASVTAAIDDLAKELSAQSKLFQSVLYRRDFSKVKAKGLHFVPVPQLRRIEQSVRQAIQILPPDGVPNDPSEALAQLNDRLERFRDTSPQMQEIVEREYARIGTTLMASLMPAAHQENGQIAADARENHPQHDATQAGGSEPERTASPPGFQTLRRANLDSPPSAPAGFSFEQLDALDPQYLTAENGKFGFMMLKFGQMENEFARGSKAIGKLRDTIARVMPRHDGVWIGLTGMPVIEYDEMKASESDTLWTNFISLAAVAALFVAGYGGMRHAILGVAVLVLGMIYSLGFVTLAIGHLNILSAAFGVILIGLGIDFGIHYVACYLKLHSQGIRCDQALTQTAADIGPGVVTGGTTTAVAFFMGGLTEFTGLRELGIIAGGGILLCILATVIVLPPLIWLADRNRTTRPISILPVASWFQLSVQKPRWALLLGAVVTILLMGGIANVRYDHNLLNLQPRHVESVDIERELFSVMDDSVWFGVSICETREQLRQRKAMYERLPSVAKTEEIVTLLPESTLPQQRLISTIYAELAELPQALPPLAPLNPERLAREVARATRLLAAERPYVTPVSALYGRLDQILPRLERRDLLQRSQQQHEQLRTQVLPQLALLRKIAEPTPPGLADLPKPLTDRFVGRNHKHLLKVYARGDIWDMDKLTGFVADLESVDPHVTGHPVQTFYASRHMQRSYILAGMYSLVAVFFLLLLDFRSIRWSLLAMTPLAFGFAQWCGLIGWLNLPFNPANTIALPLILGIGVDHGVHLVHEYRRQRGRFRLTDSTTIAVLLTATTTIASFGSMILGRHQGLQSIGQVLTLGVTCCLMNSIVFFPALLAWLSRHRDEAAEPTDELPVALAAIPVQSEAITEIPSPSPVARAIARPIVSQPLEAPPERPRPVSPPAAPQVDSAVTVPVLKVQSAVLTPTVPAQYSPAPLLTFSPSNPVEELLRLVSRGQSKDAEPTWNVGTEPRRRNLPRRSEDEDLNEESGAM
jgi:hopanoid biosynthesis associated RND transporter like protein HpnN